MDKSVIALEIGIRPALVFDKANQYGDYERLTDGSDKTFEVSKSHQIPLMEKFIPEPFRRLVVWIKHHWEAHTIRVKDDNYEMFGLTKDKIGTRFIIPEHWTLGWKYTPKAKARLDCERIECINYGGIGCHGCDDPMNQTCCRLDLNDAMECIKGLEDGDMSKIKYHSMHRILEKLNA